MKKSHIILIVLIILVTGIYFAVRFWFLKSKDFKPDDSKARSALDLRPAIIAKLQQLVKDGSGGLYHLSIEQLEPHLLSSSLDITNASLVPDPAVIRMLDSANQLPDDIFKISIPALHIEGIGINDLLTKDRLSLKLVSITGPVIEIDHKKRNPATGIYERLFKTMKSISIDAVDVREARLISHDLSGKNKTRRLNDVSVHLQNLLIDSTVKFDKKRFLFAEKAELTTQNFSAYTPDSLYSFTCGSINISTAGNELVALNVALHPRLSRKQFESRLSERKEMFDLIIPKVIAKGINWWELFNEGTFIADEARIESSHCNIYLDRSLPFRKVRTDNFPHQLLMRIAQPFRVSKVYLDHAYLAYREYNPGMDKTGTIYLDDMKGSISDLANIPMQVKQHPLMLANISGLFMHKMPMTTNFKFDLSKYQTGNFSMDLEVGTLDSSTLNLITVPLGGFMIKTGSIQKGVAQVTGDNYNAHGKGELLYSDLYLVALKKENDPPGNIKKKGVLSFLANTVLIKNANPSKGEPARKVDFYFQREAKLTFLSFVWKTINIGIVRSIGLPRSFADRSY